MRTIKLQWAFAPNVADKRAEIICEDCENLRLELDLDDVDRAEAMDIMEEIMRRCNSQNP